MIRNEHPQGVDAQYRAERDIQNLQRTYNDGQRAGPALIREQTEPGDNPRHTEPDHQQAEPEGQPHDELGRHELGQDVAAVTLDEADQGVEEQQEPDTDQDAQAAVDNVQRAEEPLVGRGRLGCLAHGTLVTRKPSGSGGTRLTSDSHIG